VTVTDVMSNGNLLVSGEKQITPLEGHEGATITNYSLDVSGRVSLNIYVRPNDGQALDTLTVRATYVDMKGVTRTKDIPGTAWGDLYNASVGYMVTVDVLNAAEMRSLVTCQVLDQTGAVISNTYASSPEIYANLKITQNTNANMVAIYRLATGLDYKLNCSANTAMTAASGANLAWAEVGTNPRDTVERTEHGGRGSNIAQMRKMFSASGWEVRQGPSQGWFD
jgi:hypothetical protein